MTDRQKFQTCKIRLVGSQQLNAALARLQHAPIDPEKPLEVIIREEVKVRGLDANAYYWRRLTEIADQAYIEGRAYSAEVWHEYFKKEYLPEEFDPEMTREGYRKWAVAPDGARVLIGSTTQLTVKGFAEYITQVEAFGAGLGVLFSASPNERRTA